MISDSSKEAESLGSLTGGTARGIALAALAWLALSVTATAMVFTATSGSSFEDWLTHFRPILLYWLLWATAAPVIYRIAVHLPFSLRMLPAAALAHLGVLAGFTLVVPLLLFRASPAAWLATEQAYRFHRMNVPIYVFVALACLLVKHHRLAAGKERQSAAAELRASQLESELNLARLEALKARIHPHFLFNTLNGIAALIETHRNEEAYSATELLGNLLRDTLDQSSKNVCALADELRLIQRYLEIEQARFGRRLRYEESIDAGCRRLLVPSLLLLPIVENAIKHGVARCSEPVTVRVEARLSNGRQRLTVSDTGPGREAGACQKGGYGLRTTDQRLRLQYGESYEIDLTDVEPHGTAVSISLPAQAAGGG